MGDRVTIVVHLPVEIEQFNRLLRVCSEITPGATVDVNGPDGWQIEIGDEERRLSDRNYAYRLADFIVSHIDKPYTAEECGGVLEVRP